MHGLSYAAINAAVFNAIKGATVLYKVHPALVGDGVPGVKLTSQLGDWSAAYTDIVAPKGITTDFWFYGVQFRAAEAAQVYELLLADGTPTIFYYGFIDPTAVTVDNSQLTVPYPKYFVANTQIQGKAGGAAAKFIWVALLYCILL